MKACSKNIHFCLSRDNIFSNSKHPKIHNSNQLPLFLLILYKVAKTPRATVRRQRGGAGQGGGRRPPVRVQAVRQRVRHPLRQHHRNGHQGKGIFYLHNFTDQLTLNFERNINYTQITIKDPNLGSPSSGGTRIRRGSAPPRTRSRTATRSAASRCSGCRKGTNSNMLRKSIV